MDGRHATAVKIPYLFPRSYPPQSYPPFRKIANSGFPITFGSRPQKVAATKKTVHLVFPEVEFVGCIPSRWSAAYNRRTLDAFRVFLNVGLHVAVNLP